MPKKKTIASDQARFGWDTGQLMLVNADGSKTRLGPISSEDQKTIDKLKRSGRRLIYPASSGRNYPAKRSPG